MSEPSVTVIDAHDPEAEAAIGSGLQRFNEAQTGIQDSRPLIVVVREAGTNRVLGGLTGRISLGVLFIDLFFLPEALRGGGLGSRVLRLAEDEGRRRGCRAAVLYTLSFRAPRLLRATRLPRPRHHRLRSARHEPGLRDQVLRRTPGVR